MEDSLKNISCTVRRELAINLFAPFVWSVISWSNVGRFLFMGFDLDVFFFLEEGRKLILHSVIDVDSGLQIIDMIDFSDRKVNFRMSRMDFLFSIWWMEPVFLWETWEGVVGFVDDFFWYYSNHPFYGIRKIQNGRVYPHLIENVQSLTFNDFKLNRNIGHDISDCKKYLLYLMKLENICIEI